MEGSAALRLGSAGWRWLGWWLRWWRCWVGLLWFVGRGVWGGKTSGEWWEGGGDRSWWWWWWLVVVVVVVVVVVELRTWLYPCCGGKLGQQWAW